MIRYFLKRFSNAVRASAGRWLLLEVSFSMLTRIEKKAHSLRLSLGETRSLIGWLHSKRLEGSKCSHCLQECNSNPHFAHWPTGSVNACSSVPHWAQRETVRVPGIFSGRGPKVRSLCGTPAGLSDFFCGSGPESWYPRWRYLRSDNASPLPRSLCAFGGRYTRAGSIGPVISRPWSLASRFAARRPTTADR